MPGRSATLLVVLLAVAGCSVGSPGEGVSSPTASNAPNKAATRSANVYRAAGIGDLNPAVARDLPRVYVPNNGSGTVSVIDPSTFAVVDTFPTGVQPQHVVPSWDLRTLWVNNNGGSLTPIDPRTARPGASRPVADPYNMYFTPDGRSMIVVAEAHARLDFRDPHTLALQKSVPVPCPGANHLDFAADGSYFLLTCEFAGRIIKVDTASHAVLGTLTLGDPAMSQPQDVRLAPAGRLFYVVDMMADGVHVIDGASFRKVGFIATGVGAHGVYPSRDGTRMYVTDRGSHLVAGAPHGPGAVTVIDPAAGAVGRVVQRWAVPGGGSPDMGNVTADGTQLWVSGRFDHEVYCFSTATGKLLARVPVGAEPHGLTVWPQPGRFSLGHTGDMR